MNIYKKFLLHTGIFFIVIFFSYCILVYYFFKSPDVGDVPWNKFCLEDKISIANNIKEPKIVFIGGSATLLGVKTKQIQQELKIPSVNLAVYIGFQTDYMIHSAKKTLKIDANANNTTKIKMIEICFMIHLHNLLIGYD